MSFCLCFCLFTDVKGVFSVFARDFDFLVLFSEGIAGTCHATKRDVYVLLVFYDHWTEDDESLPSSMRKMPTTATSLMGKIKFGSDRPSAFCIQTEVHRCCRSSHAIRQMVLNFSLGDRLLTSCQRVLHTIVSACRLLWWRRLGCSIFYCRVVRK